MKKTILGVICALGLAGAAQADPAVGIWQTQVDDRAYAHVRIAPCGDALCGVIGRTFNGSGEYKSATLGKRLLWAMKPAGPNSYKGGKIWQPSTGKTYSSKMALSGDVLRVSGCIGPICKKQTWMRVR